MALRAQELDPPGDLVVNVKGVDCGVREPMEECPLNRCQRRVLTKNGVDPLRGSLGLLAPHGCSLMTYLHIVSGPLMCGAG